MWRLNDKPGLWFSLHPNVDSLNFPKDVFFIAASQDIFDHNYSFTSFTMVGFKCFHFWSMWLVINILSVLCDWLLIVQKSDEFFFDMDGSLSVFLPTFPLNNDYMSSFKISTFDSYLSLRSCFGKHWVCTPLWSLVWSCLSESPFSLHRTQFENFYFINST